MDDGIAAQIRSLVNDPGNKHKRAADYLIRFLEQQDDQMSIKQRTPHEATAYLLEAISRQAMEASKIAASYNEDSHMVINQEIEKAIRGLMVNLEFIDSHHERTRGDRRKTG